MAKAPIEELDQIHAVPTEQLAELVGRIAVANIRRAWEERDRLLAILGGLLGQVIAGADLLGRRRLQLEVDSIAKPQKFAAAAYAATPPSGLFFLPKVAFKEAVEDLLERVPEVAPGWRAAQEVYTEGGFAAARAASDSIAGQIQRAVASAARNGHSQEGTERRILRALRSGESLAEELGIDPVGFTRAYADTVFRTVSSSSYARGRREQAKSPAVRKATAGWRYTAAMDEDTRENHRAADGLVAHFDDPIWSSLAPPLGYNCRCSLELVPTVELRVAGLADRSGEMTGRATRPPGAGADFGFVPGGGPV